MYESYWKLKEKPFRNTPDPRFLYSSKEHEDALMKLMYTVTERMGAGMLTGVFGCGKTLLGQTLLEQLDREKYKVAFISNPQLPYVELLRAIVRNLKSIELPIKKTELLADHLLEILSQILENNMRDGKETVIIIDEAHIIKDEQVLEELRLLLNFQLKDRFLLTLLLFGQPELRDRIEDNKQLEQRIAIKCHLDSLEDEETGKYIEHRMKVAGGRKGIFTDKAMKLIHDRSGGIPRRINRICDVSLLDGFGRKAKEVDEKLAERAAKSFGL